MVSNLIRGPAGQSARPIEARANPVPPAELDGPPFARKGIERWPSAPAGSYSHRPPKH